MTRFDKVTDSGERRDFGTGSVRDQSEGKGRYDLLEPVAIRRLAQHFENGARKYGDNNWKLGQPLSVYLDSGIRHGFNLLEGKTDEDHAAAMAWNAMAFISTKHWIDEGTLPEELDNIDWDVVEEEPTHAIETWAGEIVKTFKAAMGPITMGGPVDDFFDVKDEEPKPALEGRVSVRKIMDAIDGTTLNTTDCGIPTGRTITFRGPGLHEDVVRILDALEDAGYEITHAPRA